MQTKPESVLVTRNAQNEPVAVTFFEGKKHDVHSTSRMGMDELEKLFNGKSEETPI